MLQWNREVVIHMEWKGIEHDSCTIVVDYIYFKYKLKKGLLLGSSCKNYDLQTEVCSF